MWAFIQMCGHFVTMPGSCYQFTECVFSGEPKLNATNWNSEKMSKNFFNKQVDDKSEK